MFNTAFLDLPPLASASGTVQLPGSKSISNRVLLLAALSAGSTDIHDLLASDDTHVMLQALTALGCSVEHLSPSHVRIGGLAGQLHTKKAKLFLGNAGTAMRPLCAALTLLATTQAGSFELSGVARMHERPIGDLVDALRGLGGKVTNLGNAGFPPLQLGDGGVHALDLSKPIQVRGDVSSQFLTSLLLALPLVAQHDVVIEVVGELISKPYIDITLKLLAQFGVAVRQDGWSRFTIAAGSAYKSPGSIHVEADASSASYFVALGAIAPSAQGITVQGVGLGSIQGDIRFVEAAKAMGALVTSGPNELHIQRGAWPLRAIDLDCNHIPDAAMTLAVMALYASGTTTLRNIASWRVKETDRLSAMAIELRKLGANIDEGQDYISITPPAANAWTTAPIDTYDDHRMAMCLSLAAFNPAQLATRINEPHCVAKTFPDYFEALFKLSQAVPGRVPVICIDGPTASGKGTLSQCVAKALGYAWLDSGALYRLVGVAAEQAGLSTTASDLAKPAHAETLGLLAGGMQVRFEGDAVYLNDQDVSTAIRTEAAGMAASRVSALQPVRDALTALQRGFAKAPGLVADGRDMGTVIFAQAPLKVFLTASAEQRAQRRYKQLISKGNSANIDSLLADLQERDARDTNRAHAPLKPAQDAKLLDNTDLSIEQSVQLVLDWWQACSPRP